MILLDTNVISEPLRRAPSPQVVAWLDAQSSEALYLSAITVAELRAGVALLPAGRRRKTLQENLERRVLLQFIGRILPFDMSCTQAYAELVSGARKAGISISGADAFIAAVAVANGLAVATRDTAPFEAVGVVVLDPWMN